MFHSVENSGMLESSSAVNVSISSSNSLFFLCKYDKKNLKSIYNTTKTAHAAFI